MRIPAVVVSGLRSGVGKTTVTLGLIRAFSERGLKVAAFKVGPDFLDPSHYRGAGAVSARNLDPILQGQKGLTSAFASIGGCDVIVVEGVMGLFDGPIPGKIDASTAAVANLLGLPLLLVCDSRSCAQSIAAEISGVRHLLKGVPLAGVILNFVGSDRHAELLRAGVQSLAGARVLGCIRRDSLPSLPSRHLGLLPAMELTRPPYEDYGKQISSVVSLDSLLRDLSRRTAVRRLSVRQKVISNSRTRRPVTVGVAYDEAFSFYYPESIDFFRDRGHTVVFFSPLRDSTVPAADLLYFGGGFPEVFARRLSANLSFRTGLQKRLAEGQRAYAECGGLMYLSKAILTTDAREHPMVGHLPGSCIMHKTRQALGYWRAKIRSRRLFLKKGQILIGHEYHWSSYVPSGLDTVYDAAQIGARSSVKSGGWIRGNTFASYLHLSALGNRRFFEDLVEWAS